MTGSNLTFAGTIEVMYYGVWGGVFGRGFIDVNAGHVVCRQLGYPGADKIFKYTAFERLKGPLWIWTIHCNGNESNISDCAVTTWENQWIHGYYQRPRFAAGVSCRQANFNSSQSKSKLAILLSDKTNFERPFSLAFVFKSQRTRETHRRTFSIANSQKEAIVMTRYFVLYSFIFSVLMLFR